MMKQIYLFPAGHRGLFDQLHFRLHDRQFGNENVRFHLVDLVLDHAFGRHHLLLRKNHDSSHDTRSSSERTGQEDERRVSAKWS